MTAKRIGNFYVLLNGVNDVSYFGFLTLQFYLLKSTLGALLGGDGELSVFMTLTLIALQLLLQAIAEGPTGASADAFGRTRAIAKSFWCRLGAIAIVVVCVIANPRADSPVPVLVAAWAALVLAQVLMATGEAFLEGSIQAWLQDECKDADPEGHQVIVDQTFDRSSLVQNGAILFASATALVVWLWAGKWGGVAVAVVAMCLFLVGALVSHKLSPHETHKGAAAPNAVAVIRENLHEAKRVLKGADAAAVRRLIAIIVLPYPCWVMLSWFYTAFVLAPALGTDGGDSRNQPWADLLLLGVTLGGARVLGSLVGRWLGRHQGDEDLQAVFEPAVFFNVLFLFGAAMLLVLRYLIAQPLWFTVVGFLFLVCAALAKGSEEVVKLSTNKLLARLVPDDRLRATILSFVSVAQGTFGFIAIVVSGLFAYVLTRVHPIAEARQPVVIFAVCSIFAMCAAAGLLGWIIYRLGEALSGATRRSVGRAKLAVSSLKRRTRR